MIATTVAKWPAICSQTESDLTWMEGAHARAESCLLDKTPPMCMLGSMRRLLMFARGIHGSASRSFATPPADSRLS